MRAPAGIELLSDGTWDCGSSGGSWSGVECGCGSGGSCGCGGACGCSGAPKPPPKCGARSASKVAPRAETSAPRLIDYDGEILAPVRGNGFPGSEAPAVSDAARPLDATRHDGRGPTRTELPFGPWVGADHALFATYAACGDYPGWYYCIPPCPCTVAELQAFSWNKNVTVVYPDSHVHPFATSCARVKFDDCCAGNQCCYDARGNLITGGQGAGSPDKVSPTGICALPGHVLNDFLPYVLCVLFADGWETYNQSFPPYNDKDCLPNTTPPLPPSGGGGGRRPPPSPPTPSEQERILEELRSRIREHCNSVIIPQIVEEFGWERTPESQAEYERRFAECFDELFDAYVNG